MKLIWAEGAHSDWEGIARYIAVSFGKKAFDEYNTATDEAEKQIKEFPNSGKPFPTRKYKQLGLRFVVLNDLSKMVYHVNGETIIIDVIWDTRQSPKRLADRLNSL